MYEKMKRPKRPIRTIYVVVLPNPFNSTAAWIDALPIPELPANVCVMLAPLGKAFLPKLRVS